MITNCSKELLTLSEISYSQTDLNSQIFNIQTENGPRPVTLRTVNRKDGYLIADIKTEDNLSEINSHMVINPLETRVFIPSKINSISQTTLPSHQKPEKKN